MRWRVAVAVCLGVALFVLPAAAYASEFMEHAMDVTVDAPPSCMGTSDFVNSSLIGTNGKGLTGLGQSGASPFMDETLSSSHNVSHGWSVTPVGANMADLSSPSWGLWQHAYVCINDNPVSIPATAWADTAAGSTLYEADALELYVRGYHYLNSNNKVASTAMDFSAKTAPAGWNRGTHAVDYPKNSYTVLVELYATGSNDLGNDTHTWKSFAFISIDNGTTWIASEVASGTGQFTMDTFSCVSDTQFYPALKSNQGMGHDTWTWATLALQNVQWAYQPNMMVVGATTVRPGAIETIDQIINTATPPGSGTPTTTVTNPYGETSTVSFDGVIDGMKNTVSGINNWFWPINTIGGW